MDFSKFVSKYLAPVKFSPSEIEFLRQLRFAGGRYTEFAKIVQQNKEVEENLLTVANTVFAKRLKEPILSAAVALSMIGFLSSRNFLAACMVRRGDKSLTPDNPAVAKTLLYALQGEGIYGLENPVSPDYYVAGVVYDIALSLITENCSSAIRSERISFAQEVWRHGVQVASVACNIARNLLPDNTLDKDLVFDGVLHNIGKLLLYGELPIAELDAFKKNKTLPDTLWLSEADEHGLPHDVLGHFFLWNLGFLSDSSWVVMYHHQPFLASRLGATTHLRATLIWLADHLICNREFHHKPRPSDQLLNNWYEASKGIFGNCTKDEFINALLGVGF